MSKIIKSMLFIVVFIGCIQQNSIIDYNMDYSQSMHYMNSKYTNKNTIVMVNGEKKDISTLQKYTKDNIKSMNIRKDTLYTNGGIQVLDIIDVELK